MARLALAVRDELSCLGRAARSSAAGARSSPVVAAADPPLPARPPPVLVPVDVVESPNPTPRRVYLSMLPASAKRDSKSTARATTASALSAPLRATTATLGFKIRVDTPLRAQYEATDDESDDDDESNDGDTEDDSSETDSPVMGRAPMGEIGNLYDWGT